jgi:hypothetical protein
VSGFAFLPVWEKIALACTEGIYRGGEKLSDLVIPVNK